MADLALARIGAGSALDLLDAQGAPSFGVVVLDLLMPEMDGIEVLRHVKDDRACATFPVS